MDVQAISLERSPTRAEIESEIARTKNAPRGKSLCKENSPSSRVSDGHQKDDRDWRTAMERNIERIMQHLQIPTKIPTKGASAKSDSGGRGCSDHSRPSESDQKSEDVDDGITRLQVRSSTRRTIIFSTLHVWLALLFSAMVRGNKILT